MNILILLCKAKINIYMQMFTAVFVNLVDTSIILIKLNHQTFLVKGKDNSTTEV